jgi:hypothetical protein
MSEQQPTNGLYLRSANLEGRAIGPIGIVALVATFGFFGIGEIIAAATAGVIAGGVLSIKLLGSVVGDEDFES